MSANKSKGVNKAILLGVMVLGVAAFRYFDLGHYLTLDYIKASQLKFQTLYHAHQGLVIAAYMAIYVVVTGLSLPGAVVLTLTGGALFGLLVGTVVVSFASTIGATMACLVSRFLLREWVQNRFGERLLAINRGIDREGAFYLFSLRLVPIFPFFVINLLLGLTRMPLATFFWVSQLGMLPATIVFVNAGKELAQIETLSGIVSPGVLLSFAILGLFPMVTQRLLRWYRTKFADNSTGDDTVA